MSDDDGQRKLAAILSADAAGYSRLMADDEAATVRTLTDCREVFKDHVTRHRGRIIDTAGDSVLAVFDSPVEAVECAVDIQRELARRNRQLAEHRRMEFRIGVNLGDIIVRDDGTVYGDGVNIAARLESLAEPGEVNVSGMAYDAVRGKLDVGFESLGEHEVKNISEPVRAYRVVAEGQVPAPAAARGTRRAKRWRVPLIAAAAVAVVLVAGGVIWALYPKAPPPEVVTAEGTPTDEPILALPDEPSIAVLPFANMSEDPTQEYFSDGITEDLITDLSRFSTLLVIARNSTFAYKGKPVNVQDVSRELGVRYVLEGSVRKVGDQVRITAQLVDAKTGYHLWAERYDRKLTDIFSVQDDITQRIVAALKVELAETAGAAPSMKETSSVEAYDHYLRGWAVFHRYTKDANLRAREMFEKAIELDQNYARAYAGLSLTYFLAAEWQWSDEPDALQQAIRLAEKAVELDDTLPQAHADLGWYYAFEGRLEEGMTVVRRAIELDPNYADAHAFLAEILNFANRPEEAIPLQEKAIRLNPHSPAYYLDHLGDSYWLLGEYEKAIAALKESLSVNPDFSPAHRLLAIIYSEQGRMAEARAEVAEILRISPAVSLERWEGAPYREPATHQRYMDGLRKAGVPEKPQEAGN